MDTRESLDAAHSAAQELGYWAWRLIEHVNGRDTLAGPIARKNAMVDQLIILWDGLAKRRAAINAVAASITASHAGGLCGGFAASAHERAAGIAQAVSDAARNALSPEEFDGVVGGEARNTLLRAHSWLAALAALSPFDFEELRAALAREYRAVAKNIKETRSDKPARKRRLTKAEVNKLVKKELVRNPSAIHTEIAEALNGVVGPTTVYGSAPYQEAIAERGTARKARKGASVPKDPKYAPTISAAETAVGSIRRRGTVGPTAPSDFARHNLQRVRDEQEAIDDQIDREMELKRDQDMELKRLMQEQEVDRRSRRVRERTRE